MDLTALSAYSSLATAIGAVTSAIAVGISLVYLALQLRHNTRAVQAQTFFAGGTNTISLASAIYLHAEFAELLVDALRDPSSLSAAQTLRWDAFMRTNFRNFDNLYHASQTRILEADVWPAYEQIMLSWLRYPGCFRWFEEHSRYFSASLRNLYSTTIRPQVVREASETQAGSSKV